MDKATYVSQHNRALKGPGKSRMDQIQIFISTNSGAKTKKNRYPK